MPATAPLQDLLQRDWNRALRWEPFLDYSLKNVDAMRAGHAAVRIDPALAEAAKARGAETRILVLGADWCGDVVANLPILARLAELNPKLQLRVLDRDRHLELMGRFQTAGGNAIPIAIVAPPDFSRFSRWGPRPGPCQAIMAERKGKMPKEEIIPLIREWYARDGGQTLLREIWAIIEGG